LATVKVRLKIKNLPATVIGAFFLVLCLSGFLVEVSIKNTERFNKFLPENEKIISWYSHPANIAVLVSVILMCLLFVFIVWHSVKMTRMKTVYEDLAKTDVLTGIYNRRFLEDSLGKIIKTFSRSNSVLSLMMVDVDFFKRYNDTYGHRMGDDCLKIIAEVLVESISREEDFAARYGGEEFTVVLPFTNEEGARIVAKRLLENMHKRLVPHETSSVAKFVTFSIGVTTSNVQFTHSGADYIKCADQALYMSKESGRDTYSLLHFSEASNLKDVQ